MEKGSAFYLLQPQALSERLRTDLQKGLAEREAARRLKEYGLNRLVKQKGRGIAGIIARQFQSPLVYLLLGALPFTLYLGEYLDSAVIFIVLLINVAVGTIQDFRASRAFEKLNQTLERRAVVIREGKQYEMLAENLVPGDLIMLSSGSSVPADARIVDADNLAINESALTGEWVPVPKDASDISSEVPLVERRNMAFMGTAIEEGRGRAVVVETGMETEVGEIAGSLEDLERERTPIQDKVHRLARFIVAAVALTSAFVVFIGIFRGEPLTDMILVGVAIAVAMMPSGLPAAVTIILALGMESILRKGGLVKNILAAETLGATTIILTDKTGTLTEGKMKLTGMSSYGEHSLDPKSDEAKGLLTIAVLASDGFVEESEKGEFVARGRPVERAVLTAAMEWGVAEHEIRRENEQIDFLPFDSARRFAASLNRNNGKNRLYVSGAPEMLLERSSHIYPEGKRIKKSDAHEKFFTDALHHFALGGKRVIGVAFRDVSWEGMPARARREEDLRDFTFAGMLVMFDPPRPDVSQAIQKVRDAGARVVMLTGDNAETARSIAQTIGIASRESRVFTGSDIEKMDDKTLVSALRSAAVIARVLPAQKLRIARLLKSAGEVVAMTGDGVNDAPALRAASIGVAVGSGTEVAKESADLILLENNFSIIVAAIEEGRKIIDNLRKAVTHILSTSFGEVFLIGGALLAALPLPLLPIHILWANVIQEGLLTFAFAFEPGERDRMKRSPSSHAAREILPRANRLLIVIVAAINGLLLLGIYTWLLARGLPLEQIRSVIFAALCLDTLLFAFSLKNMHQPIWRINLLSNRYLFMSVLLSGALIAATLTVPALRDILSLAPLPLGEVYLLFGIGAFHILIIELAKHIFLRER